MEFLMAQARFWSSLIFCQTRHLATIEIDMQKGIPLDYTTEATSILLSRGLGQAHVVWHCEMHVLP
jgi:hypothetical protein